MAAPVQALELDREDFRDRQFPRGSLREMTPPIDDAGEPACHDIQEARDPRQQEDRGKGQLYGMSDVVEGNGNVEHDRKLAEPLRDFKRDRMSDFTSTGF